MKDIKCSVYPNCFQNLGNFGCFNYGQDISFTNIPSASIWKAALFSNTFLYSSIPVVCGKIVVPEVFLYPTVKLPTTKAPPVPPQYSTSVT
jgi:hypothetical protein